MARRKLFEVFLDILSALDRLGGEEFSISRVSKRAGIKYSTTKKILEAIEIITNAGVLLRVRDKPRRYIWAPRETDIDALASAFFWKLMRKNKLTVDYLARVYGLDTVDIRMVLNHLVARGAAQWVDENTIGMCPIDQIDFSDDDIEIVEKIIMRKKIIHGAPRFTKTKMKVIVLRRNGKRKFEEILMDVLDSLLECSDEAVSIPIVEATVGIKYDTAKRMLEIIELVTNSGMLRRICERPRRYMWLKRESDLEIIARAFFRRLLREEVISIDDFASRYMISTETVNKAFQLLVSRKVAKWCSNRTICLCPINHFFDISKASKKIF